MKYELQKNALKEYFKNSLSEMSFLKDIDLTTIKKCLDDLCDARLSKFEKASSSTIIWKLIFKKSMEAITDNLRGVSNLFQYLDETVRYEDILFAVDEHYRDHIIHSIWVMIIGYYFKNKQNVFKGLQWSTTYGIAGE